MEFERNKPTTAEDIALADAPRVTIQPMDANVAPDLAMVPGIGNLEARRNFEFETESTTAQALSSSGRRPSHHYLAILVGLLTVVVFGGAIALLYLLR